jgi:hypothetical protein
MANPPLRKDFNDTRPPKDHELPAAEYNRNAERTDAAFDAVTQGARVFIQAADPDTTNPEHVGPAIWYVTDGAGTIIDVRTNI